jgi:hypothetical protein
MCVDSGKEWENVRLRFTFLLHAVHSHSVYFKFSEVQYLKVLYTAYACNLLHTGAYEVAITLKHVAN